MFTDTLKQAFTAARAVHLNIRLLRHFFKENLGPVGAPLRNKCVCATKAFMIWPARPTAFITQF